MLAPFEQQLYNRRAITIDGVLYVCAAQWKYNKRKGKKESTKREKERKKELEIHMEVWNKGADTWKDLHFAQRKMHGFFTLPSLIEYISLMAFFSTRMLRREQ